MCGGSAAVRIDPANGEGLSPRVRGKLLGKLYAVDADGSIPACAGEASFAAARRW